MNTAVPNAGSSPRRPIDAATLLDCADRRVAVDRNLFAELTDLAQAEALQAQIVAARRARGEVPGGYKIGFTNRSIWPLYGVGHPIWGPMYNTSIILLKHASHSVSAADFILPRLEPEIVFGMARVPADASLPALVAAIDWVAHGLEIVQSVYPGWKFTAPEAFAAQSMHAQTIVGPRVSIRKFTDPVGELSALRLTLGNNDREVARGKGEAVLDGPIQALGHLVRELDKRGQAIQAGDMITTGTLTDAQPLAAGDRWQTAIEGVPLTGLTLTVT